MRMRISLRMEKMRESQGQKKVSSIQKLRMRNRCRNEDLGDAQKLSQNARKQIPNDYML